MIQKVIIRVDYSIEIGFGHIKRMLVLANCLKNFGIEPSFVSKQFNKDLKLIPEEKFNVLYLDKEIDVLQEADFIAEFANKNKIKGIIIDTCNPFSYGKQIDRYYLIELLRQKNLRTASFEEFSSSPPDSDIVVIPYVNAEDINLTRSNNSNYLIGPKYFILREEFRISRKKEINKDANILLISMGGGNFSGFTEKTIRSILTIDKKYTIKIILGGGAPFEFNYFENISKNYGGQLELIVNCTNMAEQMFFSDIAIINSGLTKYETLAVGLPTIAISNSVEHNNLMDNFKNSTQDSLIHLGYGISLEESILAENIFALDKNYKKRESMSETGTKIIDGKGTERLTKEILKIL